MTHPVKTISLQKKLVQNSVLSSVFAGCVAFILLLGISSYQTMSINDEIMDEISDMLLSTDITMVSGQYIDELSHEFDIEYQLVFDDRILTTSEKFPNQLSFRQLKNKSGYSFIWYEHQIYRTYVNHEDDAQFYVVSIQPLKIRFEELWHSVAIYLLVLVLLWLLQWAFVHFAIRKQFKMLALLSNKISKRNASNLEPISQKPIEIIELQPIVSQINHLLARLNNSLLAEKRFTADASHELRSPLSAIQMRLQLLQRKYHHHADFEKDIQQIQIDVNRNQHILENLLLLARLDPTDLSKLPIQKSSVDVIIQDALDSLEPFLQEKNISCHVVESQTSLMVNPELIYTCIRNVLDNAIRYEKANGHIYISFKSSLSHQEIIIEDAGENLSDDVLKHLGERFYRALGTKTKGSGLGLSICKKIMELHGGSISFTRSSHGGLKVILSIGSNL
jgi:two-component system, OmpR family, sensor histidine kinase QseC